MVDPLEQFRPKDRTLRRSIIDRLIDDEPDVTHDALVSVAEQIREMREVIRRDLEVLLNTRRPPVNPPAGCDELYDAIVSFGVDGILSANLSTDLAKAQFARQVERRIALFETRLHDVQVTVLKGRNDGDRALRMRIEATFRLQDGMPPISFESRIDPSTQCVLVEAANG